MLWNLDFKTADTAIWTTPTAKMRQCPLKARVIASKGLKRNHVASSVFSPAFTGFEACKMKIILAQSSLLAFFQLWSVPRWTATSPLR